MWPARRWSIARIGTNASRRVFAPRTSLLHLHLKADDSVTWRPTGIAHSVYQPIFDRFESHHISPRPSQNHCLPLFHVLPGEGGITSATRSQDIALWQLGLCCQQATHHFWLGCRLVAGFGAGLVHGGSRALRTRENWHFVECTCITAPQITCGAPWP